MDIHLTVAQNIKQLREQKKLTLDAAARCTGVSRSMLIQIEKGDVNPTISLLWKIANGYKVSFSSLLTQTERESCFLPCASPLCADAGRYLNYPTFPFDEKRLFESYRIVIAADGALQAEPHLAGSEEYLTVFQGTVELCLGEETHLLSLGDSLRFRADQPHAYRNVGEGEAALSMLIYYAN